jgi:hypothetical protein
MANFFSDLVAILNGPAFGQPLANKAQVGYQGSRLRYVESMFVAPTAGTAPAIADKIFWCKLPIGSRIVPHLSVLRYNAGTASCTANVGDSVVPARYLAATAINAAGATTLTGNDIAQAAVGDITSASAVIQNVKSMGAFRIGALIAGTGIATGARITGIDKQAKTVTMDTVASATTASLAITVTGTSYQVTDDSNSAGNSFGGVLDDATIQSVIAGAQVANNQVLVLKLAYVQD